MVCYKSGKERGAWFELKAIRDVITGKESRGESATFERGLYEAWIKYPEYKQADKKNRSRGLYGTLSPLVDKQEVVSKIADEGKLPVANYETEKQGIMKQRGRRGRPRLEEGGGRVTRWRRTKETIQGELL